MASDVYNGKKAWTKEDRHHVEQILVPSSLTHLYWSLQGLTPAGQKSPNEAALQLSNFEEGSAELSYLTFML